MPAFDSVRQLAFCLLALGLGLVAAGLPAQLTTPGSVVVTLELAGIEVAVSEIREGRIVLERLDRPESLPLVLPVQQFQTVELPRGSRWDAAFEIPGLWGPRAEIGTEPGQPTSWVFNLRPAGTVAGSVRTANGPLPKSVDLVADLPGGLRPQSRCQIAPTGKFSCALPAGSREIVVVAEAYAPVRFSETSVAKGRTVLLPPAQLRPGASLSAWVTLEDGSPPGPGPVGWVRIHRAVARRGAVAGARPLVEIPLPEDGFLAVTGLEPGPVILEVGKPGFSQVRLPPIELSAGVEIRVPEPLRLLRPLEIVVEIDPTADPFGEPWKVTLVASNSEADGEAKPVTGTSDAEGRFRAQSQAVGRYSLHVEDSAGASYYRNRDVWITNREDATVRVELVLVDIRGTVTSEGNPVSGRLNFGGRHAGGVVLESDEKGEYFGTLPRPGAWPVDIEAGGIEAELMVEVEVRLDGRRAVVDLEIPATRLFGRVVDEEGRGVADAEVRATFGGRSVVLPVARDGEFERRGLPPGWLAIQAERRGTVGREASASDSQTVELLPDQAFGPLVLRLQKLERLAGQVSAENGRPLAGAVVATYEKGTLDRGDEVVTDAEGRFSVRTSPEVRLLTAVVMAPGAPFTVLEKPNDGSPLDLRLDAEEGELVLELPLKGERLRTDLYAVRVLRNGLEFGVHWLFSWRRALGLPVDANLANGVLRVPKVAAGTYTACFGRRQDLAVAGTSDLAPGAGIQCRSGYLAGGSRLTLKLPGSPGPS